MTMRNIKRLITLYRYARAIGYPVRDAFVLCYQFRR